MLHWWFLFHIWLDHLSSLKESHTPSVFHLHDDYKILKMWDGFLNRLGIWFSLGNLPQCDLVFFLVSSSTSQTSFVALPVVSIRHLKHHKGKSHSSSPKVLLVYQRCMCSFLFFSPFLLMVILCSLWPFAFTRLFLSLLV